MAVERKHILLASPPLFGHALPLLNLARKLSQFHRVTLAVSESILEKIRTQVADIPEPIRLIGIKEEPTKHSEKSKNSSEGLRDCLQRCFPGLRQLFLSLSPNTRENFDHDPDPADIFSRDVRLVDAVIADNFIGGPASVVRQNGLGGPPKRTY